MNFASRCFLGLLLSAGPLVMAQLAVAQPANAQAAPDTPHWTASWAAAPQLYGAQPPVGDAPPPATLADLSLRQKLLPSTGGATLRIRFSNFFGTQDLHIAGASVADAGATGADVKPDSLHALRFGGRSDITIAPGAQAWSDALRFEVAARRPLAVSFRIDRSTPFSTVHRLPPDATWALPGDAVMQPQWPNAALSHWNHFVTGLDVQAAARPARVLVAFGDSITEGAGATEDQGKPVRYPELLAERLSAARELDAGGRAEFAVLNAGISGNRLLTDWVGPRGLDRFRRDVLEQSGVSHVLILIGVNDIGMSLPAGASSPVRGMPGASEMTAGLQRLVEQARARGIKVLLGTLLPFEGAFYWSEEKERRRAAVNDWIRSQRKMAGVVDFDAALRDPARPRALKPVYDSGDHLHPGNAGYAAMADAVDLRLLRP